MRLFIAALALLPVTAELSDFPQGKVDYMGDLVMTAGEDALTGKVYHSATGKDRREITVRGRTQTTVMRYDKKIIYLLVPEAKMYAQAELNSAQGPMAGLEGGKVTRVKDGEEVINGEKTTRYKMTFTAKDGRSSEALLWLTHDDIAMKMTGGKDKPEDKGFAMEVKNLKRAPQSAKLFELPADYKLLPPNAFSGGQPAPAAPPAAAPH